MGNFTSHVCPLTAFNCSLTEDFCACSAPSASRWEEHKFHIGIPDSQDKHVQNQAGGHTVNWAGSQEAGTCRGSSKVLHFRLPLPSTIDMGMVPSQQAEDVNILSFGFGRLETLEEDPVKQPAFTTPGMRFLF